MFRKTIITVSIIVIYSIASYSQDAGYISPSNALMQTNPAYASFDNDLKFIMNYGSKYSAIGQNFKSPTINLAVPLFDKSKTKRWGGLGFSFVSDKAGEAGYLSNTGISVAFAYNIILTEKQSVSASLSGGFYRRALNMNGFTTGSQYIPNSGFDPSASINESLYNQSKSYADIAAGFIWQYNDGHKFPKYFASISAYHLNKPNVSFSNFASELDFRFGFQGGFILLSKEQLCIVPEVLLTYLNNNVWYNIGTKFDFPLSSSNTGLFRNASLSVTPRYISGNIIACNIEFNQNRYSIGFAYEYNTADLSGITGYLEGYEIMLMFRKRPGKESTKKPDVDSNYEVGKKYKLDK
jgi:type IX secretion system PorP/SprF family membrane protein